MKYINIILLLFISIYIISIVQCSKDTVVEKKFNIKPEGNLDSVEAILGDYKCSFSYSCTGGTNEGWEINLTSNDDEVLCFIGRPSPPSYLLFQDFTASLVNLKNPEKSNVNPELNDNSGVLPIGDQYTVTPDHKVRPTSNFGGNIALVILQLNK